MCVVWKMCGYLVDEYVDVGCVCVVDELCEVFDWFEVCGWCELCEWLVVL